VSLAWVTYRVLAPCLGAMAPAARIFASPKERELWNERLGHSQRSGGADAWIHAASLGEASAVGPLVRQLTSLQHDARLFLTATTRTGRSRLEALGLPVALAPIDAPQAVGRFFRGVAPRRLMLVETELWPHWLLRARADGVPVAVVSARVSERSVRRYHALGGALRELLSGLGAVLCQTDDDAARWQSLGAPAARTAVVGNLKHDALPEPPEDRARARVDAGLERDRPALVLGSLRPGEARIAARAWLALPEMVRGVWQVVAVPRHGRSTPELRAEATAAGLPASGPGSWRWDDRVGVLIGYYRAADVALVGGSLMPFGGHNPMEAAACGAAVIIGPHHASQLESVRVLQERRAAWVLAEPKELETALSRLVTSRDEREAMARQGLEVVGALRGATRRAVTRLLEWKLWPVA
jgi:3-deoxy-D-manno-octulosonic-acid transferase